MLDTLDIIILDFLRANSRMHLKDISKRLKVPLSTLWMRKERLDSKMIKYVSLIDYHMLGFSIPVNIAANADDQKAAIEFLCTQRQLNDLFITSGDAQILAQLWFRDMKEFYDFLDRLEAEHIHVQQAFHIIDEIKREVFLPAPRPLNKIQVKEV